MYKQALDLFGSFRKHYKLGQTWPAPLCHLETFIAYLFQNGYAYRTASTYISAVRFQHKLLGLSDKLSETIIAKTLEGYRRSKPSADTRLPITYELLHKLCLHLKHVCNSLYETQLFKAAFTLAFFGLFRVGELVFSGKANRQLFLSDLKDFNACKEFTVYLRQSKTNQCGPPQKIHIVATGSDTCPVSAMRTYLRVRSTASPDCYLFCHHDGSPLTRYQFGAVLRRTMGYIGLAGSHYRSHSFRIGAATWLARQGVSHSDIKKFGRWSSNSFKHYIR